MPALLPSQANQAGHSRPHDLECPRVAKEVNTQAVFSRLTMSNNPSAHVVFVRINGMPQRRITAVRPQLAEASPVLIGNVRTCAADLQTIRSHSRRVPFPPPTFMQSAELARGGPTSKIDSVIDSRIKSNFIRLSKRNAMHKRRFAISFSLKNKVRPRNLSKKKWHVPGIDLEPCHASNPIVAFNCV